MQKSDGVVVVRGVAVVVGAPPPLKGPRGGAHSREVSNTVPSPSYLRTRLWPRGPCSPCVPKGTVAPPPLPPCRPSTPRPKVTRPEGQVPEVQHQDSLGIQPTPPVHATPPPPPTSHHHHRPAHAMCEYYASATGGGAERSCLHQAGPARCQTRIYRILTPPSPEPHPPCRASLFLSSISIPAPVAESCSVRAGHPPPEPSSQVSRSQPNTHTHTQRHHPPRHLRRPSAARVGRRRKRQGKNK